jgi:hypothetical protein
MSYDSAVNGKETELYDKLKIKEAAPSLVP